MQFALGQKVSFQPSGKERKIGTLVKFNRKTVTVVTESGQKWNVSPQLLSSVKDITDQQVGGGKVIELTVKNKNSQAFSESRLLQEP